MAPREVAGAALTWCLPAAAPSISSSPPSVLITYQAIGLTPPVAPKLHLAIRGPRGVWPGHTAAYRITLRRTQPHNRRAPTR